MELPALQLPGCRVEAHTDAHTLLGGAFLVSGRIPRTTSYEQVLLGVFSLAACLGPVGGLRALA